MTYTEDEVNELKLCKEDIVYFAEKYIKTDFINSDEPIKLYPKQKSVLTDWMNDKHNITLSSRQSGVSTLYAIFLLHNSLFNFDRFSVMCSHRHDNSVLMKEVVINMYKNLPSFLKSEIITNSRDKIYFINGSRILFISLNDTESLRGQSVGTIIIDNIDHSSSNNINEFLGNIVPCLKYSTSSKLIIGGTPRHPNSKQLELSKTKRWNTSIITYKDVPQHNTPEWEKAMRDIAGDEVFNTEFALEYVT